MEDEDEAASVRGLMVAALADVEGIEVAEVEEAIARCGGEAALELDSKQAESIIAFVEAELGRELPGPADLGEAEFATLGALIAVVLDTLQKEASDDVH